ncbi:hypothetical protein Tco_0091683 [Tanacetum coccineum]
MNTHHEIDSETIDVKYIVGDVVAIHSQVRKIKQEFEKTMHLAALEQPEIRSVLRESSRKLKRSRSPLGISNRPIYVDVHILVYSRG